MNQGWIADWISRKWSILIAGVIFIIGGALQTGAESFAMLVVARFVGGIGVGMCVHICIRMSAEFVLTISQAGHGRTSLYL